MPEIIQLTSISDLNLNDFKDLEKGTLKNGSIKLGKSTYSVKFIDGKVSVSRNFHFFNLFRFNAKTLLRNAFNEKMYNNTRCKNEALYTNTFKALEKNFKGNRPKSMMLFGMGGWTSLNHQGFEAVKKFNEMPNLSVVKEPLVDNKVPGFELQNLQPVKPNLPKPDQSSKIETLINLAGLSRNQLKDAFLSSLNQLKSPTFVEDFEKMDNTIDQSLKKPWLEFLQRNANRVNIFKMLNQAINDSKDPQKKGLVGWAAMMRKHGINKTLGAFLQKNMEGNLPVTSKMIDYFNYNLPCFDDDLLLKDPFESLQSDLEKFVGLDQVQKKIFTDCLINAVHREVMKLGLEFCQEQNIPVLFQWTNKEGKTVSSKELKNQLWSPDYEKDKRPKFSPILHTAMRHVQRLQNKPGMKLKLVQVNGAAPD